MKSKVCGHEYRNDEVWPERELCPSCYSVGKEVAAIQKNELVLRFHEIANIAAYLAYRLAFGLIDAKDVKLAKTLEHLDVDFIKIIAGANIDNLPAAIRLAAEELPISIEEVTS